MKNIPFTLTVPIQLALRAAITTTAVNEQNDNVQDAINSIAWAGQNAIFKLTHISHERLDRIKDIIKEHLPTYQITWAYEETTGKTMITFFPDPQTALKLATEHGYEPEAPQLELEKTQDESPAQEVASLMRKLFHQIIDADMIPHNPNQIVTIKGKQYNGWEVPTDDVSWKQFLRTQADDFCKLLEKTVEKDRSVNNDKDMALMLDRLLHNFQLPVTMAVPSFGDACDNAARGMGNLGEALSRARLFGAQEAYIKGSEDSTKLVLEIDNTAAIESVGLMIAKTAELTLGYQKATKAANELAKAQAKVKT